MMENVRLVQKQVLIGLAFILVGRNVAVSQPTLAIEQAGLPSKAEVKAALASEKKSQADNVIETSIPGNSEVLTSSVEPSAFDVSRESVLFLKSPKPTEADTLKASEDGLDLSVPFNVDEASIKSGQKPIPSSKNDLFSSEPASKTRSVQLHGDVLMTQELETEKRKTIDGAGIMINVKP